jgi:hypothetical protein
MTFVRARVSAIFGVPRTYSSCRVAIYLFEIEAYFELRDVPEILHTQRAIYLLESRQREGCKNEVRLVGRIRVVRHTLQGEVAIASGECRQVEVVEFDRIDIDLIGGGDKRK